jgi:hypothetical protein
VERKSCFASNVGTNGDRSQGKSPFEKSIRCDYVHDDMIC